MNLDRIVEKMVLFSSLNASFLELCVGRRFPNQVTLKGKLP